MRRPPGAVFHNFSESMSSRNRHWRMAGPEFSNQWSRVGVSSLGCPSILYTLHIPLVPVGYAHAIQNPNGSSYWPGFIFRRSDIGGHEHATGERYAQLPV